jgi:hypothetical protein
MYVSRINFSSDHVPGEMLFILNVIEELLHSYFSKLWPMETRFCAIEPTCVSTTPSLSRATDSLSAYSALLPLGP